MKTRDRILATSLTLFNAEGVAKVAMTKIAAELAMSQGNLHYHFRRKNDIVDRLVRRWEQESEPVLAISTEGVVSIDDLWLFLHLAFEKILAFQMILTAVCWCSVARVMPCGADVGPGRAAYQVLSLLTPFLADNERRYLEFLRNKYRA